MWTGSAERKPHMSVRAHWGLKRMARKGRKATNELEFQGQALEWLNHELVSRSGLGLDRATQEKPRSTSGKRSDLIVWKNRAAEVAFLALELKTPTTPLNDPELFSDAIEKAQHWKAPYFAIWNMREAELYQTPPAGGMVTPADAIKRWPNIVSVAKAEDWLQADVARLLKKQIVDILEAAWGHQATGGKSGQVIDAEIFVGRLGDTISSLRTIVHKELATRASANEKLRRKLNRIASEQGFKGFVEDIYLAIAGQIGYRLIGQILFYFALRRKQSTLRPIVLDKKVKLPLGLKTYWNDVRRFDYEALFKPEEIDELVDIPDEGQLLIRSLIDNLSAYDWASLSNDVLGSIFERLIPREEQILLGQFYTPRPVADLLVALTLDGERPSVVDPGCGSGTFLMSAYDYLVARRGLSHKDVLSTVWGFDLSPFATELAAINLFRQDLGEFENFPRIVPGNFFDRKPGEAVEFPPPRIVAGVEKKIPVPIPHFDCIVGNPPYLRSQNQDDLDPSYRNQLFSAATRVSIAAEAKTDLFAFFIYHALGFMKPGARLGFVTPASWLTSDYAIALQNLLVGELRLTAVVASNAEAFFPQVDVNAVLLVAERLDVPSTSKRTALKFVTLKQPITTLVGSGDYWGKLVSLADEIKQGETSHEDDRMRVKVVSSRSEKEALVADASAPRNWSKYMRAPLSYYALFGDVA